MASASDKHTEFQDFDKQKLEVASQAIGLYDKHVDTLGHNACMDAVKRYLADQAFGEPRGKGRRGKGKAGKEKPTIAPANNSNHEGSKKEGNAKKHKHKVSFDGAMKYVARLVADMHYGSKAKFYRLNLKHVIEAYPGNEKLDENAKLSAEKSQERHDKKVEVEIKRLTHVLTQHDDDKQLFINTDSDTADLVGEGRHFFHPVGYKRMKNKEKKDARHDKTNWSNQNTAKLFKDHLAQVRAKNASAEEGQVYVPDLSKDWDKMSGQRKFEYLTNPKHWHYRNRVEYEAAKKAMMMKADGM